MKPPAALRARVRLLGAVVQGGQVLAEVALRHEGLLALLALEPGGEKEVTQLTYDMIRVRRDRGNRLIRQFQQS